MVKQIIKCSHSNNIAILNINGNSIKDISNKVNSIITNLDNNSSNSNNIINFNKIKFIINK